MAVLVPTRHFYPKTNAFTDSVSKFHLHFLMYTYHALPFKLCFFAANSSITYSPLTFQQNPHKGPNHKRDLASIHQQHYPKRSNFYGLDSSRNSWLDEWRETHKIKLKNVECVVDYRNNGYGSGSDPDNEETSRSGVTMAEIVERLKIYKIEENSVEKEINAEKVFDEGSVENILRIDEGILPDSRGGFSEKRPFGDDSRVTPFPWEKPEVEEERYSARKKITKSTAELTLPEKELDRLKRLALKKKKKMKIGGAGVSGDVVEKINERWKESEVVRLKIEAAPSLNMKRMHEVLEKRTGGLVIWRSGTSVALYRGVGYEVRSLKPQKRTYNKDDIPHLCSTHTTDTNGDKLPEKETVSDELDGKEDTEIESKPELTYEDEIEILLDGLGPRYTDWPGPDPLPVDADLLPGVLPGYQPPFRLLPYGVRPTLSPKESTDLIRLARFLPPHFALGLRTRQHQGLAAAMIKLWEKSSIAKIAIKHGVQLATSEKMAAEIKRLTGCSMISRNKDFLVFYRGKSFLSADVAEALLEKGRLAKTLQDEEDQARLRASASVAKDVERSEESGTAGTLGETLDADARWGKKLDNKHKEKVTRDVRIFRHANLVRRLENKLATVEHKILKAEQALSKLEQSLNPTKSVPNPHCITKEERFMFRKLGLRMHAFLLLGRRGVFSGTIENMHLHWKYRELVKIIVKAKIFDQVKIIALSLEAESGGVLVSVDKVAKGYAIIVFRGKEYTRPSSLRPKNLLTKRKALARSIELQRHEAFIKHISTLQSRYDQMRFELGEMAKIKDHGDEELYDKIDSIYPEDEESEEEGDDAYPEVYDIKVDQNDEEGEGPYPGDVSHKHDDLLKQTKRMEKAYDENDDLLDRIEEVNLHSIPVF